MVGQSALSDKAGHPLTMFHTNDFEIPTFAAIARTVCPPAWIAPCNAVADLSGLFISTGYAEEAVKSRRK
jgi:hypothetical protein